MKLSDLHRKPLRENSGGTRDFEDVTELGDELYEPFTMTVSYWYEGASHSDHPYGEGSAREHHAANWGIDSVKLKSAARHIDENEELIKEYPAGTDVTKMPGWDKKLQAYYEDKLATDFE